LGLPLPLLENDTLVVTGEDGSGGEGAEVGEDRSFRE